MAIDSTNKRRAVIQLPPLTLPPIADGTLDNFDRMQATWLYPIGSGAAPGPGPAPEPAPVAVRRRGAAVRIVEDWFDLTDDEIFVILR